MAADTSGRVSTPAAPAEVETTDEEPAPTATEEHGTARSPRTAREVALASEVATLEAELERRERRLERVVERYESLLAEQARAYRAADPGPDDRCEAEFVWTDEPDPALSPDSTRSKGLLSRLRSTLADAAEVISRIQVLNEFGRK